jgi:predicted ArsR family transcriptional regulator
MSEEREGSGKVHRALADERRGRIVDELRRAPDGLDAYELGRRLGLHPNTIRWHLGVLTDAGIVSSHPRTRSTPGRPPMLYVLSEGGADVLDPDSHRLLATILSGALAEVDNGPRLARDAGEAWGRYLVEQPPPNLRPSDDDAVAAIVGLLDDQGFRASAEDGGIRMRRCPYRDLAPGIVCSVHEGLIDGALAGLGSRLEVSSLEAFLEPGVCVAHLRARALGHSR